jgi:phosphoribosylformylglycinamidine synthase subunit PurQ / glutaminase
MRASVIVFPGSNRERDVARAVQLVSGTAPSMVWHADSELPAGTDLVVLPGGFSYGDYLRCGAIAARAPIMQAVNAHAARGGKVLGICNGFQILIESGLLPGALLRNAHLKFLCRTQHLRVERNDTDFTRRYAAKQVIEVCIAHGDGNFFLEEDELDRIEGENRVAFRYCDAEGDLDALGSTNGSQRAIAGIYSDKLNVLGLMPHPENFVDPAVGGTDGRALFQSVVEAVAA